MRIFLAAVIILCFSHSAWAHLDTLYSENKSLSLLVGQRAQEQLGYANGYIITDLELSELVSPYFEVSIEIKLLAHYGSVVTNSFAAISTPSSIQNDNFEFRGYDRPMIHARQLVYGDFNHGRWYLLDLGMATFNVSGYVSQFYRYWSGRVGLHESLETPFMDPQLELGLTVRSLTEYTQPSNVGLIYPPSLDAKVGLQKEIKETFHVGLDLKLEQALSSVLTAGSYDVSKVKPTGASTYIISGAEFGWNINSINHLYLRFATRTFRWPDDSNSAIWNLFEEGYFGHSYALYWKGTW